MPAGAAFASRIRVAVRWLLQWMDRAAGPRLARNFHLMKPSALPDLVLRTGASTTGFGALVLRRATLEPLSFWADTISWRARLARPRGGGKA